MSSTTTTSSTGMVTSTTNNRFAFDVLRHDGPVLVDVHAPWCSTRKVLEPVLDDLAAAWTGRLRIGTVDIERHPGPVERHRVRSIPTLDFFDCGIETGPADQRGPPSTRRGLAPRPDRFRHQ